MQIGRPILMSTSLDDVKALHYFGATDPHDFNRFSFIFTENLNPGPPQYQADILPIELSWLGFYYFFIVKLYLIMQ